MDADSIIKKYELNRKTWTTKGFHGILHFFFVVGEQAVKPLMKYYGDCHKITVFAFHDNYCDWYWNNEDMVRLRKSFIEKVNKNPKVLDKLLDDWHKRVEVFNEIMKEVDGINLSKLSDDKLLDWYNKWYGSYLSEYGISIGIQDAFSMQAEDFLEPYFREIIEAQGLGGKFDEHYLILTNPVDESFFTKEYRDRLKLLKGVGDIKKHAEKYYWIHNNYAKDMYLGVDYFEKELKRISKTDPDKELKKLDKEMEETKRKKKELISKLKLDQESKNLIKITEVFAYMQDERKKYVLIASHYQTIFMDELGKRLGLSRRQMEYTYIHELGDLLKKKEIDINVFEERRRFVMVIHTLEGYEVISGKLAEEIYKKVLVEKGEKVEELKGTVASKGKAKGKVKIVLKIHDIINVQEGDILVASMTRPEMVVAMEKAAAIVTDEGGITCHAAIVSREMKKPCIIGTKVATKVLKTGDLVEVDAENGIVKKL
jgi:phosphohistidine swiveling domain-containing protein